MGALRSTDDLREVDAATKVYLADVEAICHRSRIVSNFQSQSANTADTAVQSIMRATYERPDMTTADVPMALAHAVAILMQGQLPERREALALDFWGHVNSMISDIDADMAPQGTA